MNTQIATATLLTEINDILEKKYPNIHLKSYIMVSMLNGSIDWNLGCRMRNYLDTLDYKY